MYFRAMVYAVIVAGGKGLRMGGEVPKQFLPLAGEAVLLHTVRRFFEAIPGIHVRVVLPADALETAHAILAPLHRNAPELVLLAGGETRFDSVKNGLLAINGDAWVMVHDGVRPIVPASFLQFCLLEAQRIGSAIPVVPVKDSMRWMTDEKSTVLDRSRIMAVQTPQVFQLNKLKKAFEQPYQASFTDEATVYEAYGEQVHLVAGLYENVKITTPEDLFLAEYRLKNGG
jgi:2-C-methyl-D-erythritol 4-phosphate cytidylyltransferase